MAKFLANENVPGEVVEAARLAGHDLAWIAELSPGADDDDVLATALAQSRVLVTFDKTLARWRSVRARRPHAASYCAVPERAPQPTLFSSSWQYLGSLSLGKATFRWRKKEECAWRRCP